MSCCDEEVCVLLVFCFRDEEAAEDADVRCPGRLGPGHGPPQGSLPIGR